MTWLAGRGARWAGPGLPANTARKVAVVSRITSRGSRQANPAWLIIVRLFGPRPRMSRSGATSSMATAALPSIRAWRTYTLAIFVPRSRREVRAAIIATVVTPSLPSGLSTMNRLWNPASSTPGANSTASR